MAKMFYTLDEAKAALNKNEEEIKQFAREGRLREFRDGPRLMFKADQVETLKSELAEGTEAPADLGPSDSGSAMAIGLTDSHGMSGTGLTLVDESGRSPGAGMTLKEDTALAADLGLSGSVGGMPSPARSAAGASAAPSAPSMNMAQGSRAGVDVFQNDEVDRVDPSAQTSVSATGHDSDQMNIEAVGSGSGLLDLTKESDDTSLGAELLDEIAPSASGTNLGRSKSGTAAVGATGSLAGMSGTRSVAGVGVMSRNAPGAPPTVITYIEKPDPLSAAFGAAALGATLFVIFGAFALITGVLDTAPTVMTTIAAYGFLILVGAGVGVSAIFFLVGFVLGKAATR
ncbi:MAG: hypothetical protein ABSF29_03720 [Tepidisphaeraceae bacterium]|jgi:hypothetical protein